MNESVELYVSCAKKNSLAIHTHVCLFKHITSLEKFIETAGYDGLYRREGRKICFLQFALLNLLDFVSYAYIN